MSFHTRRLTKSGASGVFTDGGTDRFDPLLLAEGEYWFRDHSCNLWTPQRRRCASVAAPGPYPVQYCLHSAIEWGDVGIWELADP